MRTRIKARPAKSFLLNLANIDNYDHSYFATQEGHYIVIDSVATRVLRVLNTKPTLVLVEAKGSHIDIINESLSGASPFIAIGDLPHLLDTENFERREADRLLHAQPNKVEAA